MPVASSNILIERLTIKEPTGSKTSFVVFFSDGTYHDDVRCIRQLHPLEPLSPAFKEDQDMMCTEFAHHSSCRPISCRTRRLDHATRCRMRICTYQQCPAQTMAHRLVATKSLPIPATSRKVVPTALVPPRSVLVDLDLCLCLCLYLCLLSHTLAPEYQRPLIVPPAAKHCRMLLLDTIRD
jgi:hypothetical protein